MQSLDLSRHPAYVLGRSAATAKIVVPHESVSRQHAAIVHAENDTFVMDLGSASGTFLDDDGETVSKHDEDQSQFGADEIMTARRDNSKSDGNLQECGRRDREGEQGDMRRMRRRRAGGSRWRHLLRR